MNFFYPLQFLSYYALWVCQQYLSTTLCIYQALFCCLALQSRRKIIQENYFSSFFFAGEKSVSHLKVFSLPSSCFLLKKFYFLTSEVSARSQVYAHVVYHNFLVNLKLKKYSQILYRKLYFQDFFKTIFLSLFLILTSISG